MLQWPCFQAPNSRPKAQKTPYGPKRVDGRCGEGVVKVVYRGHSGPEFVVRFHIDPSFGMGDGYGPRWRLLHWQWI